MRTSDKMYEDDRYVEDYRSVPESEYFSDSNNRNISSILIISQFFWPEPIGSAPYVADLAKWFVERGYKTTVLTGRPYYPEFKLAEGYEAGQRDIETVDSVAIIRVPTFVPARGRALRRLVGEANYLLRATARLLTGRVRRSYHVISVSPTVLAVLAGSLAKRRGGQHLAVVHDIQSGLAEGLGMVRAPAFVRILSAVEAFALNRADRIVVLSERMKQTLQSQGVHRPIEVIPLWVDPAAVYPLPFKAGAAPTVLYSGNLGRKQGLDQILSLAEILLVERPDVRVVIRGTGSCAGDVEVEAGRRQLTNTYFEPLLPLDRLNEGLAEGDIHLVPQNPDAADFAVPSKVYNIMAAGRPVVATAASGSNLHALQEDSRALLCVPPNDARALADAVIALAGDPAWREELGLCGRKYVEGRVARDLVLGRYTGLLLGEGAV